MKNIILLCGPPGSGKSTLANKYVREGYFYVNQDSQGKQHLNLFENDILNNHNIIVDRMGFNVQQRDRYLKPAKEAGYKTKIIVLHESYDTCLTRCLQRVNHETIKEEKDARSALNTFFSKYERVQDSEADEVVRIWPEGYKKPAIWVDIDNTLANNSHREHFLSNGKKDWKGFFNVMDKDIINRWCLQLIIGMHTDCDILICSARPDDYKEITEQWLDHNDVPYNKLIMRRRGDFRRDDIVKEIFYEFEVKTTYDLWFSVDDRKQVIDKMRSHNIVVLDCAGDKGNF